MRGWQNYRAFAFAVVALAAATSTVARGQTFSVLYNLGSNVGDPYQPQFSGIIAQGRDGDLYSTAAGGGNGFGAVFKVTPEGVLSVLYSFKGGSDGNSPVGGLTLGTDGNFYGTTRAGGTSNAGTIFKITPTGGFTSLYSFLKSSDGAGPYAPPVEGTDGSFYGTAFGGGSGHGTIYRITSAGTFTSLYQFDITHGFGPRAPLVQGTDGNFYGTTAFGGSSELGSVFKITRAGKLTVLYNFDAAHGQYPTAPLIQGSDGNFYGTTGGGGASGNGVIFKITSTGKLTVLHSLNGTTDGKDAEAGLLQATDGNFYGANAFGGKPSSGCASGCGTIFQITPKGGFSVLYNFDLTTGSTPYDTPFQHTNGVVHGDTQYGGTGNVNPCSAGACGVFYSWTDAKLPAFVSLLPYSGKVGKTIEFLGQGFTSKTTVAFDGTAAKAKVVSSTYLTAAVPNGAGTGPVTVTTSSGPLTSNKIFRVTPQLKSFSPASGPVGTVVTITGVSLTQTTKVTFGGVKGTTFTVNSDMQVAATVPMGAKTGHIAITTAGGTAVSSGIFTVTQ